MKAVVLEIRGGYAAVLREDGVVEKIRRSCTVGETIELKEQGKITRFPQKATRWVAAAAAAIILVSGGSYGYNNAYAYSYVTLDANPSIEYVLNRRNRLLSVEALNDDAKSIVETLEAGAYRGMGISDILAETVELLGEEDYLIDDQENCLLINVTSRGQKQREELNEEISGCFDRDALSVYMTNATMEEERSASELGLSTGRYKLMEDVVSPEHGDVFPEQTDDTHYFEAASVAELLERSGRRQAPDGEMPARSDKSAPEQPVESAPMGGGLPGNEGGNRPASESAAGPTGSDVPTWSDGESPIAPREGEVIPMDDGSSASGEPSH